MAGQRDRTAARPARARPSIGRRAAAGTIGYLDYSHPVVRSLQGAAERRFLRLPALFRYRALQTGPDDRVLARFDDGAVAAAERRIGTGRVIAFGTSLDDSWNDLALKPVYLPLVHQLVRYLARYEPPTPWRTVGQVVDLSASLKGRADRVVVTPSSEQMKVTPAEPGSSS